MAGSANENNHLYESKKSSLTFGGLTYLSSTLIASSAYFIRRGTFNGSSMGRRFTTSVLISAGCGATGYFMWWKLLSKPLIETLDCAVCAVTRGVLLSVASGVVLPIVAIVLSSRFSKNPRAVKDTVRYFIDTLNFEGQNHSSVLLYFVAGFQVTHGYRRAIREFENSLNKRLALKREKELNENSWAPTEEY